MDLTRTTGLEAILIVWFVVSVMGQFESRVIRWLRNRDHIGLIPRWTFFAPRPGRTDYHLMVQVYRDDDAQSWREKPLAERRTLIGAVWNPEKRNRKALTDLVRSMVRASSSAGHDKRWHVQYSMPYIALLSYLSDEAAAEGATHVRFMVLEAEGFCYEREPWPVFLSARHVVA
jgi:hypothetical protein